MPGAVSDAAWPPTINTSPWLPLWALCGGLRESAWPAMPTSQASGGDADEATPRSSNHTSPAASRPWAVNSPGFKVSSERVWRGPLGVGADQCSGHWPVSAFRPLGRSTHNTGARPRWSACRCAANTPVGARHAPMPSKASMAKSKLSGGCGARLTPAANACAQAAAASLGSRAGSPAKVTSTRVWPPWA